MVISENCCNFIVLKYKVLQTLIAMITEDKVTELFCIADEFCKFFDAMIVTDIVTNVTHNTVQVQKVQKVHVFSLSLYINSGLIEKNEF